MQNTQDASVEQLRRVSERNRASLADTVSALHEKLGGTTDEIKNIVSPTNIKHEIRSYVRNEKNELMQSIQQKAKDNPMQAVAIGVAVAYPTLALLRLIPTPLLLIGAGLWLTGSQGKKTLEQAQNKSGELLNETVAIAKTYADTAKAGIQDSMDKTRGVVDRVTGAAREKSADALASIDSIKNEVANKLDISGLAEGATDQAAHTLSSLKESGSTSLQKSRGAIVDFVEKNPLLVAGVGTAIGAFLAGALPVSSAENKVYGTAKDALKTKANAVASDGLAQAKDLATGVIADVSARASSQGLDAQGLNRVADSVIGGVKSIAERALATGLGTDGAASDQFSQKN